MWKLHSLRGVFRGDWEAGRQLLLMMREESKAIVDMIEQEMVRRSFWNSGLGVFSNDTDFQ